MGIVTDYLLNQILKQVEDYKLVVWYDPEAVYADALAEFQQRTTDNGPLTIARYDGVTAGDYIQALSGRTRDQTAHQFAEAKKCKQFILFVKNTPNQRLRSYILDLPE